MPSHIPDKGPTTVLRHELRSQEIALCKRGRQQDAVRNHRMSGQDKILHHHAALSSRTKNGCPSSCCLSQPTWGLDRTHSTEAGAHLVPNPCKQKTPLPIWWSKWSRGAQCRELFVAAGESDLGRLQSTAVWKAQQEQEPQQNAPHWGRASSNIGKSSCNRKQPNQMIYSRKTENRQM